MTSAQPRVAKKKLAAAVRTEFLHAWNGYKKYAWGHDDLKPLSKAPHDWYGQSLLMTPVDALDTMILMGLNDEARITRDFIAQNLSFDKDIEVQNFEITIRLLGGLLSSYQLTGDRRLPTIAEDLGTGCCPSSIPRPACLIVTSISKRARSVTQKTNPAEPRYPADRIWRWVS